MKKAALISVQNRFSAVAPDVGGLDSGMSLIDLAEMTAVVE